jgi:hypothetical protein
VEIINSAAGGLPVTYDRKSAGKDIVNKDELWKSDLETFDNKIGFLTNLSTTAHTLIYSFPEGSREYDALSVRLKEMVAAQSKQIDRAKGISVDEIPQHWSKYQRIKDDDSEDVKQEKKFYNSILLEKRPYFMRYLYSHYDREYKKYKNAYNLFFMNQFGITLEDALKKENPSAREKKYLHYYHRYNHLIDNNSVMNVVCHHMEDSVKEIKNITVENKWSFETDKDKQNQMAILYRKWKDMRKKFGKDEEHLIAEIMNREVLSISTNPKEIAKLALNCSSGFGLMVFGAECEELWRKKQVKVPVLDANGDIEFNGEMYSMMSLEIPK